MGLKKVNTSYVVSPDGEVLEQTVDSTDIKWEYAEPFVGFYPEYMGWRHEVRGGAAISLFMDLADMLPFESNVVSVSTTKRREIMDRIGGEANFYRVMKILESYRAVIALGWFDQKTNKIHRSRGEYMLNPMMVWRGKSAERQKEMEKFLQRIKQGY